MSVLITLTFAIAAGVAIYSLFVTLRDYGPKALFLLHSDYSNSNALQNAIAVWPTRLRIREEDITGVPQVLFRHRKPFVRKAHLHPIYTRQRMVRKVCYAMAPERVIELA
mgnify:CR=1 FL=1